MEGDGFFGVKSGMNIIRLVVLAAMVSPAPFLGAGLSAQETRAEEFRSWGRELSVDPRVSGEMMQYEKKGPLSEAYVSAFTQEVRSRVLSAAEKGVSRFLTGECEPSLEVTIGGVELDLLPEERVDKATEERREDLEKSLVRSELVACFQVGDRDPGEALEIFLSSEFRMAAESRIVRMWADSVGSCLETKGVMGLVDPTRVCNRTSDFRSDNAAAQLSQVVFNGGEEGYQDVYFKASLKTFVKIPGGLALHYINFTRSQSLGRLERWVGTGQIEDSQKENVKELRRVLSR